MANFQIEAQRNEFKELVRRGDDQLDVVMNKITSPELQRLKQVTTQILDANISAAVSCYTYGTLTI